MRLLLLVPSSTFATDELARNPVAGQTYGLTNELVFQTAGKPVHVHDIQGILLHLHGLEHTRLTYRFKERDLRLTDVAGNVVGKLGT